MSLHSFSTMGVAEGTSRGGSIVAFEGHPETVSTQLRLLPTSPQILILPSIECYLPSEEGLERTFEAHSYIRKAHEAVNARNETAKMFLQGPAVAGKRLVFTNGGTPSAHALCIRALMKYVTDGDHIEAEAMFNLLVRDGMSGLEHQNKYTRRQSEATITAPTNHETWMVDRRPELEQECQDPITRAMRAADALDRQTESLQPSNELDLTVKVRPRSLSLPVYGYSDEFGDAAPFFMFGAERQEVGDEIQNEEAVEDAYIPKTPNFSVTHYEPTPEDELPQHGYADLMPPPESPSCVGESYHPAEMQTPRMPGAYTPWTDIFSPGTPSNIVYGEAAVVDMRGQARKPPLTRVRSLDRICAALSKERELYLQSDTVEIEPLTPTKKRPQSCMAVTMITSNNPANGEEHVERPRTVTVKAKRATVVIAPVPQDKKRKPARTSYVDKGTDAEDIREPQQPFQPVLPFLEDLVIYFKDDVQDALLDGVIQSFKNGNYPVLSHSNAPSEDGESSSYVPSTPKSHYNRDPENLEDVPEEPEVVDPSAAADEYDPFAYIQSSRGGERPKQQKAQPSSPANVEKPPTPRQTPPPSVSEKEEKVHVFRISSDQTAVAIHNALRSILGTYFPPESQGYNSVRFSLLPELEGLWRPIFREAEPGSPRADNRRMDQILAIGSQRGVLREYSAAITGQLEKLGTKSSGLSRSGKLDFRYLLANAMQAFTAQPLTAQTSDNPFTNPFLLATFIVPHLETYLALHSEVRYLLLEFPPEHLPTVLALQKLVGVDLMKVAQIVEANSKEMTPFTNIRGVSANKNAEASGTSSKRPLPPTSDASVSKANFLLTSTASDNEIATFISTIWKILTEVSNFYVPEDRPKKVDTKDRPPSLQSKFSPPPKVKPPTMTTISALPIPPVSPGLSSRANSMTETIKTRKSAKSKHSRTMSRTSRRRPPTGDGASFVTFDPADDSDYDGEARRLMPVHMQKPRRRKGDSRKALKFLGLA